MRDTYEEVPALSGGKRCGVQWAPWMGDWFTSWSPRNDNMNAEGPWDHWVDLAIQILKDPMTATVRPEVYELAQAMHTAGLYDETGHDLTDDELESRFSGEASE